MMYSLHPSENKHFIQAPTKNGMPPYDAGSWREPIRAPEVSADRGTYLRGSANLRATA